MRNILTGMLHVGASLSVLIIWLAICHWNILVGLGVLCVGGLWIIGWSNRGGSK